MRRFSLALGFLAGISFVFLIGAGIPIFPYTQDPNTGAVTWVFPSTNLPISPTPNSLATGLNIVQTGAGTSATPVVYNMLNVTDNSNITGGNFGISFNIINEVGSLVAQGGREALQTYQALFSPTNPSNGNRNYVGGNLIGDALSGDGGTGNTAATAQGAIFGAGIQSFAEPNATHLHTLSGGEVNVGATTGSPPSSGYLKNGWAIVPHVSDAVAFTHNIDLDISTEAPSTPTIDTAISINDYHNGSGGGSGSVGLTTSGYIIRGDSEHASLGTIGGFADLSKFAMAGPELVMGGSTSPNQIRAPGAPGVNATSCGTSPSAAGNVLAGSVTVGGGTVTSCTVNWGVTLGTAPRACLIQSNAALTGPFVGIPSTTGFTFGAGATFNGDIVFWHCIG